MDAHIYDALRRFEEENIVFPPFNAALSLIEEQLELYRNTGVAQHLLVLGESGTGKSSICRYLVVKYPRRVLPERDVVPALNVSVPAAATIAGLASEILRALGDPDPNSGTVPTKTHRITTLCRGCSVELLLIDEAQHLHDRGRATTHYMVGDWLKQLIDELSIPTVFLGLPRLEQLLHINEQLRRRFSKRALLALGQKAEASTQTECLQLFLSLAACMPVPVRTSGIKSFELGERLYFASDGRVAYIKKLLSHALSHALEYQATEILLIDLENAFTQEIWRHGIERLNPFNPDFDFRRLDRAGEPFEQGEYRSLRRA